jgi:hypothetical protein
MTGNQEGRNHVEMIMTMQKFYQLLILKKLTKIEPPYTPVSLTPKTPAKPVSSKKTPKYKTKLQLEENSEYTTPKKGQNCDSLMMKIKYIVYHQCLVKVLSDFQ